MSRLIGSLAILLAIAATVPALAAAKPVDAPHRLAPPRTAAPPRPVRDGFDWSAAALGAGAALLACGTGLVLMRRVRPAVAR